MEEFTFPDAFRPNPCASEFKPAADQYDDMSAHNSVVRSPMLDVKTNEEETKNEACDQKTTANSNLERDTSVSFRKAVSNNNIRALIAVVSKDSSALDRLFFRPHLIFELIKKNDDCKLFLLKYLTEISDERRQAMFACTIKKTNYYILMLKKCNVPALWLSSCKLTRRQRRFMRSIGYVPWHKLKIDNQKDEDVADQDEEGQQDIANQDEEDWQDKSTSLSICALL